MDEFKPPIDVQLQMGKEGLSCCLATLLSLLLTVMLVLGGLAFLRFEHLL